METTAKEILDKWHKKDATLELWVTKKHALKAMEEYAELVKNHGVSHHGISTLQSCPAVCHGNVINGTCNVCGAKW